MTVLFEISSGSVTTFLFNTDSAMDSAKLILKKSFAVPTAEVASADGIKRGILKALKESAVATENAIDYLTVQRSRLHKQKIKNCYVALSSPWYISQTKVIRSPKEESFTVSPKFLADLVEVEKNRIISSLDKGRQLDNLKDKASALESHIMRVKLNGYTTEKPMGKSAQFSELSVYLSVAPEEFTNKVIKTVNGVFGGVSVEFATFPYVLYEAVSIADPSVTHYLLIDVREEITELTLVKKGIIFETYTIPCGTGYFIRKIAESMNTLPAVAHSMLRICYEGKSEPNVKNEINEALSKAEEWPNYMEKAFKYFAEEYFLPSKIRIESDPVFTEPLTDIILKKAFRQFPSDMESYKIEKVSDIVKKDVISGMKSTNQFTSSHTKLFVAKELQGENAIA